MQFAEEDVPVCEGFFHDEGVPRVVGEGVAEGGRFGGALCGVVVAGGLDDAPEFAVGVGEAWVRFLHVHLSELFTEGGFGEAKGWSGMLVRLLSLGWGIPGRTSPGFDDFVHLLSSV